MIGAQRYVEFAAKVAQHVEVRHRRLHHDDVGALGDVGARLAQRLAPVAVVLLVALAIAAVDDLDVDRVAEGSVQSTGVLRRVGHDDRLVEARPVEGAADRADLAVHHPARRDDRGTGVGLGQGDASVEFERRVVVDRAVGTKDPAVTVAGVLIETEVGHEDELVAELVAQRAKRDLRDALGIPGATPEFVLRRRHPEEDDAAHTDANQFLDLFAQ